MPALPADMVLFASSLALLAVSLCYTPGPNNTLAVATGLERGVAAAVPLALGSAIGANVSLVGLGYGLGEVFRLYPVAMDGLRVAGTVYLLWLAWRISGLRLPAFRPGGAGPSGPREADTDTGADIGDGPGRDAVLLADVEGGGTADGTAAAVHPASASSLPPASASGVTRRGAGARSQAAFTPPGFIGAFLLQLVNVKVWISNAIIVSNYVGTGEGWDIRLYVIAVVFTVAGTGAVFAWAALGALMRRVLTRDNIRRANLVFALLLVGSIVLLYLGPPG